MTNLRATTKDLDPVPTTAQLSSNERFNKTIDLDSRKVTHHISVKPGEKIILCRCWQSKKFPLCDGLHGPYNKERGDNLGPVHVTVEGAEPVKKTK